MEFPEVTGLGDNLVALLQAIGVVLLVVVIVLIALMMLTSFGNEHRHAIARGASVGALIGFVVLANAHRLADVIQRIFPF